PIAQNLHFDVARAADETFEEDGVVAERSASLATGLLQATREIGGLVDDSHAASAAAESCLDDERESDLLRDLGGLFRVGDGLFSAGDYRDPGLLRELARGRLVAEQLEQMRAGSDKSD